MIIMSDSTSQFFSPFAGLNGANPAVGSPLAGKLFVVLGAGGAGKSLAYGAAQKGARVVVANRTLGMPMLLLIKSFVSRREL